MPKGIPKSGVRKSRKSVSVTPVERKPSMFSVSERFDFISQFVKMIGKKKTNSLVITGDAGIGKSFNVTKNLSDTGLREMVLDNRGDFIVIKGFSTPRALYQTFWDYSGLVS